MDILAAAALECQNFQTKTNSMEEDLACVERVLSQKKGRKKWYERVRKTIFRFASPSSLSMKTTANVVKVDLEDSADPENLGIKHEVSLLVRDFLREHKSSISTWTSELREDGAVVIPNVFYTEAIADEAEELLRTFRGSQQMFKEHPDLSIWTHITNAAVEDPKTHLRFQSEAGGYLWLRKHFPEKLKVKHKIDLYMSSLAEGLGIVGVSEEHEVPRFGSTLLMSLPGCAAQIPHTDYSSDYFKYLEDKTPAYFLMFGGKSGMYLHVWRKSFVASIVPLQEVLAKHIGKIFKEETLYVPPDSILICRGDLVHAGAEYPKTEKMASIRYHLQFDRRFQPVDNIIELRGEFRQDDEGHLSVGGQSASRKRRGKRQRSKKSKPRKRQRRS